MNAENFAQASRIIEERRQNAITQQQNRVEEIRQRIPEIAIITQQIFETSKRLTQIIRSGKDVARQVAALRKENLEGQEMIQDYLTRNGYPADYLEIHYTCPYCRDTGIDKEQYCSCLLREINRLSAEKLNQSVRFRSCTFENFSLEYYRGLTYEGYDCYEAMEGIYLICRAYAAGFRTDAPSLLFYGKTGRGKTHLSLAIANVVLDKGFTVLYDSVINFMHKIENEHFGRAEHHDDTLTALLDCDLLVLDDLGTEFSTPFSRSVLYNIINTRMNRCKPVIISTNLDFNALSDAYEERITSRIFSTYRVQLFVGDDVRSLKRERALENTDWDRPN